MLNQSLQTTCELGKHFAFVANRIELSPEKLSMTTEFLTPRKMYWHIHTPKIYCGSTVS